jgi:hypothetical protein
MKRVTEFTPHQLETWAAILGCFETRHVNRAVVEFGLSVDPFPDVGKIADKCKALRLAEREYCDGHGRTPPPAIVQKVASALNLEV